MIIKIVRTASSTNLINYLVSQEHEILDSKGILPNQNIEEIMDEFRTRELTNSRAKNIAYNIIVSFPSEDNITELMRLAILEEIMDEFNGGSDLWFAVSHSDTSNHKHFHCALSAIKLDGISIDMSNFAKRAKELSRKLEIKYDLIRISNERTLDSNQAIKDLKFAIDHALGEAQNMKIFIKIMFSSGYNCKIGRGITFTKIENSHTIKGSDVGRDYSYQNLKKNFEPRLIDTSNEEVSHKAMIDHPESLMNLDFLDLMLPNNGTPIFQNDLREDEGYKKKKRKKNRRI